MLYTFDRYSIDKLDTEKSFEVELFVTLCIDDDCDVIPVVSEFLIPIPFCNRNGTLSLPGDGTLAGYVEHSMKDAKAAAVDLVLNSLGIKVMCE